MNRMLIGTTMLSVCLSASVLGAIRHVDDSAPGGGSGANWGSPYNNLQTALAAAQSGDTIKVAQGTYKPTTGTDSAASFVLKEEVVMEGGYAGYGASNPDDRDIILYETILSGNIGNTGDETDNSYIVVTANDTDIDDEDTWLQGFTITGGYNSFTFDGGGIAVTNGASPRIDRCTITDNKASTGAGVFVQGNILTHDTCEPVITNCIISSNLGYSGGGGIGLRVADDSNVTVIDTRIENNDSNGQGGGGGVLVNHKPGGPAHATLVNCLIRDNVVEAGMLNPSGLGGGILIDGFNLSGATADIINCTIVNNTASAGGGIYVTETDNEVIYLRNSIVWLNNAASAFEIFVDSGNEIQASYNDVRDKDDTDYVSGNVVWVTAGSPPVDTNIGQNPVNHYPNFVNSSDDAGADDWRLMCASPCINTGNPTSSVIPADAFDLDMDEDTTEATPDLDLHHRVVGSVGSVRVDMGAYEKQPTSGTCPGDVDSTCTVDVDDLVNVILAWGACSGCPEDTYPAPCGNGQVDVDDLVAVILGWGACEGGCLATGTAAGADPESYEDCEDMCSSLSGDAWTTCMQGCFMRLCQNGQTEFCDD
jgi:hypothetical protein